VRAIFDLAISETDKENMSEVETEIMSHFPDKDVSVSCTRVDAPAFVPIQTRFLSLSGAKIRGVTPEQTAALTSRSELAA
jgi:hypothetical protein